MKKAEDANAYYNKQPAKMNVYDAGESVQNMPIKKTEESHKQCSPGEFGMNKEGNLAQHIKWLAEKQAGPVSEYLSGFNPLNWYGGTILGGGAALAMPTRSLKRQAEYDSSDNALRALANVLVPGMGPYNGFKRIGAGIRSPEMKGIKARQQLDKARREDEALSRINGPQEQPAPAADVPAKAAGWKTEAMGTILNPLNLFGGNYLGSLAAAATPTRTLDEQAQADNSTWSNLFVPGASTYNYWKRIGAATRSPEMRAMRRKAKMDRLQREAGEPKAETAPPAEPAVETPKQASAFVFGQRVNRALFGK